jgi:glycerol-3-phosphate acyltransferase PlsY
LKGAVALWLARWLLTDGAGVNWWVAGGALMAVLGHCFPVWLKFRGGKGVATGVGVFLALSPLALGCAAFIFILVVWTTRYVSLGSMAATASFPLCVWLLSVYVRPEAYLPQIIAAALACGALIIFMHRANIRRLMRGTESKFK